MTHLKFYVESLKLLILSLFLVLLLGLYSFQTRTTAPEADLGFHGTVPSIEMSDLAQKGKALFKANCASCHNKNMKDNMSGPALAGALEKWEAFPKEDLYAWIRNSQRLIAEDHPLAKAVWQEWQPTIMSSFPTLETKEIDAIVDYIKFVSETGK